MPPRYIWQYKITISLTTKYTLTCPTVIAGASKIIRLRSRRLKSTAGVATLQCRCCDWSRNQQVAHADDSPFSHRSSQGRGGRGPRHGREAQVRSINNRGTQAHIITSFSLTTAAGPRAGQMAKIGQATRTHQRLLTPLMAAARCPQGPPLQPCVRA